MNEWMQIRKEKKEGKNNISDKNTSIKSFSNNIFKVSLYVSLIDEYLITFSLFLSLSLSIYIAAITTTQ